MATLECQYYANDWAIRRSAPFRWWYPEKYRSTLELDFVDFPHVWFAYQNIPCNVRMPFDCKEKKFRIALDATVREYGERVDALNGPIGGDFLDRLIANYSPP